jgi:hypothetical protein
MDFSKFSEEELVSIVDLQNSIRKPPTIRDVLEKQSIEKVGQLLDRLPQEPRDTNIFNLELKGWIEAPSYWQRLKKEFNLLICTDDKEYADLRKKVDTSGGKSQTAIVGMIAAGVAVNVGAVAGALVPFCALLLIGALRIGKNAYCSGIPLDVPAIESKAKKTVAKKKIAKKK